MVAEFVPVSGVSLWGVRAGDGSAAAWDLVARGCAVSDRSPPPPRQLPRPCNPGPSRVTWSRDVSTAGLNKSIKLGD